MEKVLEERKAYFAEQQYLAGDVISDFSASQILKHPTYLTIQLDTDKHILLNPDKLQNINHSCDPNVFFDTDTMQLKALRDIHKDEELTFFYPSSEWDMAQPFTCNCRTERCLHEIRGAKYINRDILSGYRVTSFVERQLASTENTLR